MTDKAAIRQIDFLAGIGLGVIVMFVVFCIADDIATAETIQKYKDGRIDCQIVGGELVCREVNK